MASITFTDGTGAATLDNSKTAPADRFFSWEPYATPVGDNEYGLGTGARHTFVFRTDYGARFEMRYIPNTDQAKALRLIEHLLTGGTCTVTTADSLTSIYATCTLAPGTTPEFTLADTAMLEYTLRLDVINTAASPVRMICQYS